MVILRKTYVGILLLSLSALTLSAQTEDVTKAYIDNSTFDTHFDYVAEDKGNVAQEILDVFDWITPTMPNYTIGGVYQFGTKKTFNGASVPAKAYDGSAIGGGLAVSTGWNQQLLYKHPIILSPGKYAIVTAIYNCGDKTAGASMVGWYPKSGTSVTSTINSFPIGKWIADTVRFEVTASTEGSAVLGLEAAANGSANTAKIIIDYVKLLRDTPIGAVDIDYRKTVLSEQITIAENFYADGTGVGSADLNGSITSAKNIYNSSSSSLDDVIDAINILKAAVLAYRYANPTGSVPTVVTNTNYACGSTMAFGRMTITGVAASDIVEQGFCWSTNPNPTINDNKTKRYLSNNGRIFWINHLTPSTVYYMRPYVITGGYALVYGDAVKIVTLPKGNVSFSLRDGCPDDFMSRVKPAAQDAVDYWNDLTNIQGLHVSIGYGSGTPTAECSYGGWMTVGPNQSYQKTGTLLHEMLHATGVGQHWLWYGPNSPLRETGESGNWLGVRANRLLQFWDNSSSAVLHGDKVHLWPYGINGAHEDVGTDLLYIGNSLIAEAIAEDGLPPTGGFAVPAYVFNQEDNVKYYIKNESESHGLFTSYLSETKDGKLLWRKMSNASAVANDSAAWYITYNPQNCYYQLRNVSTGRYVTYFSTGVNGITTSAVTIPSANQNFHFLPCHVDAVNANGWSVKGFWLIHPESNISSPKCLAATANGTTQSIVYNIGDNAKAQRWIFLKETEMFDTDITHTVIKNVIADEFSDTPSDVYSISGVLLRANATGLDGLGSGMYIINGKKIIKKRK